MKYEVVGQRIKPYIDQKLGRHSKGHTPSPDTILPKKVYQHPCTRCLEELSTTWKLNGKENQPVWASKPGRRNRAGASRFRILRSGKSSVPEVSAKNFWLWPQLTGCLSAPGELEYRGTSGSIRQSPIGYLAIWQHWRTKAPSV